MKEGEKEVMEMVMRRRRKAEKGEEEEEAVMQITDKSP